MIMERNLDRRTHRGRARAIAIAEKADETLRGRNWLFAASGAAVLILLALFHI